MSEIYKGLAVPQYTDAADGPLAFRTLVDSGPIPRFATAAARDAAIAAPIKGQVCWREDATTGGAVEVYNGTVWAGITPTSVAPHTHLPTEIVGVGQFTAAMIPNLDVAKITTGVFSEARLPNASTTAQGVVQLSTSLVSTSTSLAATASAAKAAYDQANTKYDYATDSTSIAGRRIWIQAATPAMSNGDVWFKI